MFVSLSTLSNAPVQKHKKAYKNNASSKAKRQWAMIHKTETVHDSQHPTWRKFTLDINQLCVGNIDQAILLEVYDWGAHFPSQTFSEY